VSRKEDKPAGNQEKANAVTALRIFRPPLRAAVTLRDGGPSRLACSGHKHIQGEIVWAAGPWRSSGDWWDQEGWARDEWDIAMQEETGIALYRLVRDLLSGGWYVEGTYD
jgi:protein ImuB